MEITFIVGRSEGWPDQVVVGPDTEIEHDVFFKLRKPSCRVFIGSGVYIGRGVEFESYGSTIRIGDDAMVGSGCKFIDHDHGLDLGLPMKLQPVPIAPITLEDDVWLGVNVVVLRGVTVGRGAVVGAGAIVNRDVPPNEIWAGVPAKKIGSRPHPSRFPTVEP